MWLSVEHKDGAGSVSHLHFNVSLPAFLKHAALAGQRHSTLFPTLTRGIGLLLYYQDYVDVLWPRKFYGFNRPQFGDPTELGDFSTIVGKAFADFLAKRVVGASYTFTYEAALLEKNLLIKGPRPDFFCISPKGAFALESKGRQYANVSDDFMGRVKEQSDSGDIAVKFSYASVAYNLYEEPRCRFHDPVREDTPDDKLLQIRLVRGYYESILNEIRSLSGVAGVNGIEELAASRFFIAEGRYFFLVTRFYLFGSEMGVLVDFKLVQQSFEQEGVVFGFEPIDLDHIYVDRDGVGVIIF